MSKYPLQLTFSRRPSILHFKLYDNSHWDLAQCLCRHRSNKLAQLKTVITKHWKTDTNTTLGNTVAEVKSCATYAWILLKTLNDEMKTDSFHGSKGKPKLPKFIKFSLSRYDYYSRIKIFFSLRNQGQTLTNFTLIFLYSSTLASSNPIQKSV